MTETLLLALVIAKFRGYKLQPLIKCWPLYPIIIFECLYLFFQINIFIGNYQCLAISSIFKAVYMYMFLIPMFSYRLYNEGFIGSIFIFIGTMMNNFVMQYNNGKMPVFPTLSYITGYIKPDTFYLINDIHVLGNIDTNYKIFSDFIDTGYSVLSIGDIFIRVFIFIIIYGTIKHINNGLNQFNID